MIEHRKSSYYYRSSNVLLEKKPITIKESIYAISNKTIQLSENLLILLSALQQINIKLKYYSTFLHFSRRL